MNVRRPADLSRVLKARRLELGLTQAQVADRAGVTRQLVARLENGAGDTAALTLLSIAHALELRFELVPERRKPAGTATDIAASKDADVESSSNPHWHRQIVAVAELSAQPIPAHVEFGLNAANFDTNKYFNPKMFPTAFTDAATDMAATTAQQSDNTDVQQRDRTDVQQRGNDA